MSNADGVLFILFGVIFILSANSSKQAYIVGTVITPSVFTLTALYVVCNCIKDRNVR